MCILKKWSEEYMTYTRFKNLYSFQESIYLPDFNVMHSKQASQYFFVGVSQFPVFLYVIFSYKYVQ